MVPDRAGADTQVIAHIALSQLRGMDGASELEAAWLAARAGEPGFLADAGAEAAACDALIVPVVTGHPDWQVVDQILQVCLAAAPYNSASLPLDIGYSDTIPASIRRAVMLRDRHCAWPRCGRPAAVCDVH
jgi:hypothetical protein